LAEHFLKKYGPELKKRFEGLTPSALDALLDYPWPGNVRELENVVYEAMVYAEGPVVDAPLFPARILARGRRAAAEEPPPGRTLREAAQSASENTEKALIEKALREAGGNRTEAARRLGVSRRTLFNKMKALGI
jgi:DNA-binding NtrC family response regulator